MSGTSARCQSQRMRAQTNGKALEKRAEVILFLGMYPLARLDSAAPVRIFNLYQSLKALTPTILIVGTRVERRWKVLKHLISGKLRKTRCVYVESSTGYATETELFLLLLCKLFRIPVAIYIRDAYQLFPDYSDRTPLKVRVLDWLWRRTIQVYKRVADVLLFPTEGLARQFRFPNEHSLLPPAGFPSPLAESLDVSRKAILYVGAVSPPNGVDLLLEAMRLVVRKHPDARCLIATNEKESKGLRAEWEDEPWVCFTRGSFDDLPEIMKGVYAAAIPRRRNLYNSFALPIKLFDYISFGKPVVVTDCEEQARYVNELDCGLVVEDRVERIAAGILRLFDDPDLARRLGANGYRAVQLKHSWRHRAEALLAALDELSAQRSRR